MFQKELKHVLRNAFRSFLSSLDRLSPVLKKEVPDPFG